MENNTASLIINALVVNVCYGTNVVVHTVCKDVGSCALSKQLSGKPLGYSIVPLLYPQHSNWRSVHNNTLIACFIILSIYIITVSDTNYIMFATNTYSQLSNENWDNRPSIKNVNVLYPRIWSHNYYLEHRGHESHLKFRSLIIWTNNSARGFISCIVTIPLSGSDFWSQCWPHPRGRLYSQTAIRNRQNIHWFVVVHKPSKRVTNKHFF